MSDQLNPNSQSETFEASSEQQSPLFLFSEEEAVVQLLANHPGLTREEAEEMARAFGF